MKIKTVRQREFVNGSNKAGIFWEHRTNDDTLYVAQKNKGCWWWVLYQLNRGQVKTLNCGLTDSDGNRQEDPLYERERQSAPLGIDFWLERLAEYIERQDLKPEAKPSDRQPGR